MIATRFMVLAPSGRAALQPTLLQNFLFVV
jgi:hypothetical protein